MLDRTGEPIEEPPEEPTRERPRKLCDNPDCDGGWIGYDKELRPIPCPVCKEDIYLHGTAQINDHAKRLPSELAQQAILKQEERERYGIK